jgi:hypothetical protein
MDAIEINSRTTEDAQIYNRHKTVTVFGLFSFHHLLTFEPTAQSIA